ncbi:unnamed protein product, partial [Closterium sp. NIES-54]
MASLRVLTFDHEGIPLQFDTWLDDLQLYLLSDIKDSVSLFDHVSGAATAPPATSDCATCSQWLTRDAAARLAIHNHLPLAECAHFGQHRTAQAMHDAVVARYSSPATANLGRLLLPKPVPRAVRLFHRRGPATRLPDSLRSVRDHFLSLDPTSLTVDLLEQHLIAAETSAVAVGAARGTPRPPFFEGCSPSPLAPSYASSAAADVSTAEDVAAASASAKHRSSKGKGGKGGTGGSRGGGGGSGSSGGVSSGGGGGGGTGGGSGGSGGGGGGSSGSGGSGSSGGGTGAWRAGSGGSQRQHQQRRSETQSPQQLREWYLRGASGGSCLYVIRTGVRAGQTCGKLHTQHRCFSRLDDAWRAEFDDDVELPRWADLLKSRIAILDLDFDAILSAMYALSVSAEGDCYRYVPPDPGIAAAALGASESGTLLGTAPAEALHTFTLDSGASRCFFQDSTTLTPLPAPVLVRLADPSGGPVVAHSSTVLPCPADAMVTTTTPGGQRVLICTCTRTGRHLVTFTRQPGSSLYTLTIEPSQVAASSQVSTSSQVAASYSCRLLSHQTHLWHHCLGHPSLPRLRGMQSRLLISSLPRSLPPLPPSPAPCLLAGTSPTLRWTGEVGDASVFLVLGSRAFVRNTSADKLSPRAIPCGPAPSGVSQVDPLSSTAPVEVAVGSGAAPGAASRGAASRGAASGGATFGGAERGGAGSEGAGSGGAEPEGVEPVGAQLEGAESGGAEPRGAASSGDPAGASPQLSPQQLREWLVWCARLQSGAPGAGSAGVTAGASGTGDTAAAGPGGAHTMGAGNAGTGGVGGAKAGDPTEPRAARAGGSCTGGAGAGGAGAGGAGVGGTGAGGTGAARAGAVDPGARGAGGAVRPRAYFVPLLQQVLGVPSSPALTPPLLCPPPDQSQLPLQPASPMPAPSPYIEEFGEDFECLAAAVPRFPSMLLAPEGDPDAPDILTPRSYAEAITVSNRELTTSRPSPPPRKMTTLRVLLHVAAQSDYELHSLDFSTAFLQGSLHEEIWLRCPPGFTESFPIGTQWSPRRPNYSLRQAPREWHDTLRTALAALGFAPATADTSLFLCTDTSLPPFFVLVYVDDLVFATFDAEALTLFKSGLQKRHTCTDLGELRSYLGLQITHDRARCTITLTKSHMVQQVLQRFGFQFSSPQPTPLSASHSLLAPPSDESVEPNGLYPELVGCLMYMMTCTRPDLAYPLSLLPRYVGWDAAKRVLRYLCSTLGMGLVLGGRGPVVLTGHADASWSGQVAASSQVVATASRSGPESAPCSCRLLSHQTLLWHHRLGHPSLPRLRGMASRVFVSGLPQSLPPLPPGPTPTCVPCVEGRQRAAPHSSEFPPTEAPLQTLHMD